MEEAKRAKKHRLIQAAAQDATERADLKRKYGRMAWLAAVTQNQMTIATEPTAGKASTMAAGWLVENAGMKEPRGADAERGSVTNNIVIGDDAARIIADALARARKVQAGE